MLQAYKGISKLHWLGHSSVGVVNSGENTKPVGRGFDYQAYQKRKFSIAPAAELVSEITSSDINFLSFVYYVRNQKNIN